ncbi:MAG: NAD-dependent epimerase/dehydratase family protein [Actinobacteria bacterium]|uniref:Unannotated protein n=1 Tax=freshwater metagenome TaxID=449393 RepID=A0A6J5ZYA2_9ZZZZ|nr:NAD-dependent epimerase/dehydratase family protein [Actinomycetota bacterium]
MRLLITGGAGFVGSNLACQMAAKHPDWSITAVDNLHRDGSKLNLPRIERAGVRFVNADVRDREALLELEPFDALLECSAEPSVMAGIDGETGYAFESNVVGAYNCLELARRDGAQFIFLSTSRVYPVAALAALQTEEHPTRFALSKLQQTAGASEAGISEAFPLDGARTLYGATKLSAELLIAEYAEMFGMKTTINRCGVIAGPWQMGKADQGVFAYWMLAHHFKLPLGYIGFGGSGRQVRDLLHVDDLVELVDDQLTRPDDWAGVCANVGGGLEVSLSLLEATELCREITGNKIEVEQTADERPGDVPIYVSDCSKLFGLTDWRPRRDARTALEDIGRWIGENEDDLRSALIDGAN